MVHGVRLRDGKAEWYRNRWVRTPAVAHALGGPVPPCAPTRAGLELLGANTNVLSHTGRTVDVEVTGAPMMHDFSLTENHVVFYDPPVTFDPRQAAAITVPPSLRALSRLVLAALIGRVRIPDPIMAMAGKGMGGNANLPYRWNRNYPARVGVMPRAGGAGDLRWFDVAPATSSTRSMPSCYRVLLLSELAWRAAVLRSPLHCWCC